MRTGDRVEHVEGDAAFLGKRGIVVSPGLDRFSVQMRYDDPNLGQWNVRRSYLRKVVIER